MRTRTSRRAHARPRVTPANISRQVIIRISGPAREKIFHSSRHQSHTGRALPRCRGGEGARHEATTRITDLIGHRPDPRRIERRRGAVHLRGCAIAQSQIVALTESDGARRRELRPPHPPRAVPPDRPSSVFPIQSARTRTITPTRRASTAPCRGPRTARTPPTARTA